MLKSLPIKTIRVRNGETYKTVTSSDFSNPRYFIQLFNSIETKSFTPFEE